MEVPSEYLFRYQMGSVLRMSNHQITVTYILSKIPSTPVATRLVEACFLQELKPHVPPKHKEKYTQKHIYQVYTHTPRTGDERSLRLSDLVFW